MERDKRFEKILKEEGVLTPSEHFTEEVMMKVRAIPRRVAYKPIIGRKGRLLILGMVLAVVLITLFTVDSGTAESLYNLPDWKLQIPEIDWKISSGLVAAFLALFILVLSDSGLSRHRSQNRTA